MKPVRGWLILAILPSCASQPSADDRTAGQIVATRFDQGVDFGGFSTFAIDPVVSITSDATTGNVAGAVGSAVIVNQIVANMQARGYRQVGVSSGPDMGINATVFTRVKAETSVTTGYWWGLPGYTTPTFWGYPGGTYYAPWNYASLAFKSTTIIIQIVDLHDVMPASSVEGGTLLPEVPGAIDSRSSSPRIFKSIEPHVPSSKERSCHGGARIIDVVALVPEVHYYFGPDNGVVPFLGVGAGFASVKFHVLVSDFDLAESSSGLILSPEGGILIPFDRDGIILQAVTVGLRWSFITAGFRDVNNTSYVGLTLGLLAY